MRAFIHGFQGKPYNSDCQAAYDGFQQLGIEPVLFTTNEEFDTRNPEDVVVGGTTGERQTRRHHGRSTQKASNGSQFFHVLMGFMNI